MREEFGRLAGECDLKLVEGHSPDRLPELYLYSVDMRYRYAFGRWWGQRAAGSLDAFDQAIKDGHGNPPLTPQT